MAAGTVGYEDTRGNNKDYLGMVASQIKDRVTDASDMANEERQFAEEKAEEGGTSLDEAGVGRGYFFGKALGSRFGGDAIARTRGRFAKTPSAGIDPGGTTASRFRGGFDYNVTNRIINDAASDAGNEALTNSVVTGFAGVQQSNIAIAKALVRINDTLSGIERTQMNMARAIMFQGYMMAMLRSEQQRAAGRDSLRREERSIEGSGGFGGSGGGSIGGQGYGGAGGTRAMTNVSENKNNLKQGLASLGTSAIFNPYGQKGIIKGVKKVSPKAARALAKNVAPILTKKGAAAVAPKITTTGGKAVKSAVTTGAGRTITKNIPKGGRTAVSLARMGMNNTATRKITKNLAKNMPSIVKKPIAALNPTKIAGLLGASKAPAGLLKGFKPAGLLPAAGETGIKGMASMMGIEELDFLLKDLPDVPMLSGFDNDLARMTGDQVGDLADMMGLKSVKSGKKAGIALDIALRSPTISTPEAAVKMYGELVTGTGPYTDVPFSTKEADEILENMLGEKQFKKWAKMAKKPMKAAAKTAKTGAIVKASSTAITKQSAKTGGKAAAKAGGKAAAKAAGRSLMKQIPLIAGLAGVYFGIQRAMEGDLLGAGLEITSGIMGATGLTPGIGLAIDGFLLGRDLGMMNKGGKVHAGIGGMIPGGGVNKDTIPTMLTTGEFIMNRNAVDEIGSDTLSFMNNNAGNFGFSKLLGGSGSDLDLTGISTNVEEIAPAINALSQQIVQFSQGGGSNVVNNVVNNYGSGEKPGEGGGDSDGGDFSDSGLDAFRLNYLGSLM